MYVTNARLFSCGLTVIQGTKKYPGDLWEKVLVFVVLLWLVRYTMSAKAMSLLMHITDLIYV